MNSREIILRTPSMLGSGGLLMSNGLLRKEAGKRYLRQAVYAFILRWDSASFLCRPCCNQNRNSVTVAHYRQQFASRGEISIRLRVSALHYLALGPEADSNEAGKDVVTEAACKVGRQGYFRNSYTSQSRRTGVPLQTTYAEPMRLQTKATQGERHCNRMRLQLQAAQSAGT